MGRPDILVISNLGPSGDDPYGGVFITQRLRGLASIGHRIHLLLPVVTSLSTPAVNRMRKLPLPDSTPALQRNKELATVRWHPLEVSIPESLRWAGLLGYPEPLMRLIAEKVVAAIRDVPVEVVQAHGMYGFWAGGLAREVARELKVPFTVTLHGSDVNKLHAWRRPAFRRVAHDASGLFFVSEALRSTATRSHLVPGRSAVTPNGIDGHIFSTSERTESPQLRLLFVGSLARVKGADRLPAVLRAVRALQPDAHLTVIGDGPLRTSLTEELTPMRANLVGRVPPTKVAAEMQKSDVVVLPSRSEGWPCVILEAQACGARVVSTDVGGCAEAIARGGEWVRPDPFSAEDMAQAVIRQWKHTGTSDLAIRAAKFDWSSLARLESDRLAEWTSSPDLLRGF